MENPKRVALTVDNHTFIGKCTDVRTEGKQIAFIMDIESVTHNESPDAPQLLGEDYVKAEMSHQTILH